MFPVSPLILLIEDDKVFRQLMLAHLELKGARMLEASGSVDGLNQALLHRPDLIVTGLCWGHVSGLLLIKQLKRHLPRVPVIVISDQQELNKIVQALAAGAEDYLLRPAQDWGRVEEAITRYLEPNAQHLYQELREHVSYFYHNDIAASRLCQTRRQLPECRVGEWRLSCQQSSPWLFVDYVESGQDVLLLLAEFNPLDNNSPVLMTLMSLVLHESWYQYPNSSSALPDNPATILEYINQLLLDVGFVCRVNVSLFRLPAKGGKVQLANGGMKGNRWLNLCDVGSLGVKNVTAQPLSYCCELPFSVQVRGEFGGEIQITAKYQSSH